MHVQSGAACNGAALATELIICEGNGRLRRASRARRGDGWDELALPEEGLWPMWSPDGAALVMAWVGTLGGEVRSKLRLLDDRGLALRDLYVSPAGAPPVIAPRVPHYASWSPDSRTVSFVAAGAESLGLYMSDAGGLFTADPVVRGAPIFHSWSDDSRHLAIHAGAELLLYRVAERETVHLASDAVGFRTPVFIAGGLAYGVVSEAGVSLVWRALEGPELRTLGTFPAGVALQRAGGPASAVLSVALADGDDAGTLRGCWLYDLAAPGPGKRVVRGPFHASAWSPAGDRLALVVPTQMGDGRVAVHVHDADGRSLRRRRRSSRRRTCAPG